MKYYRMAQEWYGEEFEDEGQVAGLASLLRQVAEELMETDARLVEGLGSIATVGAKRGLAKRFQERAVAAIRAQKGQA